MIKEKELKYMGTILKYKEYEFPEKMDNYNRPLVIKVAKQSDAEQVTDAETGVKRWTNGAFFDMYINSYIKDEEYEDITEERMEEIAKKLKL